MIDSWALHAINQAQDSKLHCTDSGSRTRNRIVHLSWYEWFNHIESFYYPLPRTRGDQQWQLLLSSAAEQRRLCETEGGRHCLISVLMDRWWWCGRDNADVISSSNRLVFICPAGIPLIRCSDALLFWCKNDDFHPPALWGQTASPRGMFCYPKQHELLACISNILVMFLCEATAPQSCFCLCFCTDQKPTVVKDGHLLCPAPVLHEVGQ